MFRLISNEAFHILKGLSRDSMTTQQLLEYRKSMPNLGRAEANSESVYREVQLLQRWGLITWVRQVGNIQRIYHITIAGRQFIKDWILIDASNLFGEYHGFTSDAGILNALDKNQRSQFVKRRRVFVDKIICNIKKAQFFLSEKEKARQLLLQYHIHYFQGELRWLDDIDGPQGIQNE